MDLFPTRDQLIEELRAENKLLRELPKVIHYCRVCDQHCQQYKRNLYSTPSRLLIALYRLHKKEPEVKYFHIRAIFREANTRAGGCGYELLGKFNLAELGEPGFWKITNPGIEFVRQQRRIPKYVLIYNDNIEGHVEENTIDIVQALGKKFNLYELLNR